MNIAPYLDSTYLKTPQQSGLSNQETLQIVKDLAQEANDNGIFAVMIRPDYVAEIRKFLDDLNSKVILGTVIGFHEGTYSAEEKFFEAKQAIDDGADELDFVINYKAFIEGEISLILNEFLICTKLCIQNKKVAKWIIEIASMNDQQIADITSLISKAAQENFDASDLDNIFIKSSTGFFVTENNKPNGATFEGIKIMLDYAGLLPVKAAGGVRSYEDAEKMINMGVKRIGTSSALSLINNVSSKNEY